LCSARAAQPEAAAPEDALEMGEQHLDAVAVANRGISMRSRPVFVWRSSDRTTSQGPHCRHCNLYLPGVSLATLDGEREKYHEVFASVARKYAGDPYWDEYLSTGTSSIFEWHPYELRCPRCGWWASGVTNFNGEKFERIIEAILRDFDINDRELAINELASHVSRRFEDVYSLSPRRFEELVASIYSNLGWKVELTKQTRDGGADLVCLKRGSDETCIVECKRYSRTRKVGIGSVDRLIGAAFRIGTNSAHLVTTSSFSSPAKQGRIEILEQGFDLDLIDGCELLKTINAFADPKLSKTDLEKIYSED
jgi:restriction endonuclease